MLARIQKLRTLDPNIDACISQLGGLGQHTEGHQHEHGDYLNVPPADGRSSQSGALLNTIKLPPVLRQLTDRLPKPNYESSLSRH